MPSGGVHPITPYWHACELLADGRGVLVPFADPLATGHAIAALLAAPLWRRSISARSYSEGRAMIWPRIAERYVDAFMDAIEGEVEILEQQDVRCLTAA